MDDGQDDAAPVRVQQQGEHEGRAEGDDDLQLGEFPGDVLFHAHMDWHDRDEGPEEEEEPEEMDAVDHPGRAFAERHVRLWNARGRRALCGPSQVSSIFRFVSALRPCMVQFLWLRRFNACLWMLMFGFVSVLFRPCPASPSFACSVCFGVDTLSMKLCRQLLLVCPLRCLRTG